MNGHQTAVWSGVASFFATILALGAIDIFNPSDRVRLLSSVVVGIVTAGAVYAKERLNDAKQEREGGSKYAGDLIVTETNESKTFLLQIPGDPNEIDKLPEVTFKVIRKQG